MRAIEFPSQERLSPNLVDARRSTGQAHKRKIKSVTALRKGALQARKVAGKKRR